MVSAPGAARRLLARVVAVLPSGHTLPEAAWRVRHRAVLALLLAHAVVLGAWAAWRMPTVLPFALGVPGLGALLASSPRASRLVRSCTASVSVMATSAVVVHLSGGYVEAHFHFFVMVPVIALYEDWLPFGLGITAVLLHHGIMGTADPMGVYLEPAARAHPWRFALIHAGLFTGSCVGSVVNWRLHESARATERQLTACMTHRAEHDALTGLPNRAALLERGAALLERSSAAQRPLAVLLLDLDRFKEINDVLGHACGDDLLRQLAPVLSSAVRGCDVFARLGGDEFAAVLLDADEADARAVATRLHVLLEQPVEVDGIALDVEASIGLAVTVPGQGLDLPLLLQRADTAMYVAKRARSRLAVWEEGLDPVDREALGLLGELRRALIEDQIVLHYQPKVGLPDLDLQGVEALARWQHPVRGLLPPSEFVPAAESTALIVPLTLKVLDIALGQVARWRASGQHLPVAVNLSPRCLSEDDLVGQVLAALDRHGLPPRLLELEITENTLAQDPERALATLRALHEAGIRISIDDFGTGYSSMSYLKQLPVAELKIDRSFVLDLLDDEDNAVLVRSVVDLGHNLGLNVVAEGVEDLGTLAALHQTGCDVVQGYHVARPMPAEALDVWLSQPRTPLLAAAPD